MNFPIFLKSCPSFTIIDLTTQEYLIFQEDKVVHVDEGVFLILFDFWRKTKEGILVVDRENSNKLE